jgi:KilA-N domain
MKPYNSIIFKILTMAKRTIIVEGDEISFFTQKEEDYISLTDIAKKVNSALPADVISNWIRNKDTIEFLEVWERLSNPNFNLVQLHEVKNEAGHNRFVISPSKWIERTNAIGLITKAGRYGSGTFAHKDIAMAFCYWVSPAFQLYVVREFQRLKAQEAKEQEEALDWNLKRTLAKINYHIHTDAVRTYLLPPKISETSFEGLYYASEADILNLALFGMTAKKWREANPEKKGNIRDDATTELLLVLSNLENLNAEFIKLGMDKQERLKRLNETAIHQMSLFADMNVIKALRKGN